MRQGGGGEPLADPVAEGTRIATAAFERGIPLRLMGGVAVAVLCPSSRRPPLERSYADVDFAAAGSAREEVKGLMDALGYEEDREFNVLHGHRRLYFWDPRNSRQVDVFVEEANLCHRIRLGGRIEAAPLTLAPADLALLKLQVVETNEKDYLDICALFADHELGEDERGINVAYIAALTASDWGLWKTVGMVAERTADFTRRLPDFGAAEVVSDRLGKLRERLHAEPKSRGWKLRARIGERRRWYELPEEVH